MEKHAGTFDFILDTVSADHDIKSDVKNRFSIDIASL
jgi:hypothetical protein